MRPRVLGVLPAKGGSVRLPHKNILPLGGRPLLAWAGGALRDSGVCDHVVVSTESAEVAQVAGALGFAVRMRPEHLAHDPASVDHVVLHVLDDLEAAGERYDVVVYCMLTCPFVTATDIQAARRLFQDSGAVAVISVTPFDHTPFAALGIDGNGRLTPHFPEYFGRRSQEMPRAFRPTGAVHVLDVAAFRQTGRFFHLPMTPYEMPPERCVDIDTAADLHLAEAMLVASAT